MSLIYNASFDSQTRVLSLLDKAGNVISSCEVPSKEVDDITKPLTFKATQDGSSVRLKTFNTYYDSFQTSRDGGNTWTDYTIGAYITLNTGDEVSFRAKYDRTSGQNIQYSYSFEMTGQIEAWHNVMSMYRTNDFATYESVVEGAFSNMFINCTSLTKAPKLPATTLANYCYYRMFLGCQSLTKAPELPATKLAEFCYSYMFSGCSKLKEVRVSATATSKDAMKDWLKDVSATGDFYCNPNATIFPTDSASGIPKGWRRLNIDEEAPAVDDITKPLTFRATQDGSTVTLKKFGSPSGAFQTSSDGGKTWVDYTIDTAITLNTGDEVAFRAKTDRTSAQGEQTYFRFNMTGKIEAWHNVMSMIRTNDFATYNIAEAYAFTKLFSGCTSLTKAPALPATTLEQFCYLYMFYGCQSLTKAPELPATTLARFCYSSMFEGCQSLTEVPELRATTLASYCYDYMFSGCQSLTKAPELPATTLAENCYRYMFSGCQSLKEVRIAATTTATYALYDWLSGVSATGDFYCNPNATIFPSGTSGIPANWTRKPLSDYPVTP